MNNGIKCGHCGQHHPTVAEVRNCAVSTVTVAVREAPITERQLPYLKDLLAKREVPENVANYLERIKAKGHTVENMTKESAGKMIRILIDQPVKPQNDGIPESIPDGRYAFKNTELDKIVFYRVVTKRDGERIVQKVLGSPGDFRYVSIYKNEADKAISHIIGDPAFASQLFGQAVGACGVCGSPLTDPESIALGIGPVCAKKYDW